MSSLIMPGRPSRWPSCGLKMRTPNRRQRRDLRGHDDAAAAAVHLDVPGARLIESLAQVAEVLDVPALVGRDRHPLHVLLEAAVTTSSTLRSWPRWITSAPWACRMRRMMLIAAS